MRICSKIEKAYWFYLDFYCTDPYLKLRKCSMGEFATHIFQHLSYLEKHVPQINALLQQWEWHKQNLPTFGAIILDEVKTKVLLVQNYGGNNNWGFPKGKIDYDEEPHECAIREVWEETGFDITNMIDPNDYIESTIKGKIVRLYVIWGVRTSTLFQPRTQQEIMNVDWFAIEDLPVSICDWTSFLKMGISGYKFSMVTPFVE
ncbi:mRNA-decapping enzyme 2 [Cyphomyrmex costatus]|uniref:mRNA-decapping enzyme 2 n=2 Tax=Cyphomyrmex costatus TaxID=456900 RepID=A0A151IEG4_9HYME|nr:mRNA-decapping enzyme 2 [Cyphomyrmex costatus]